MPLGNGLGDWPARQRDRKRGNQLAQQLQSLGHDLRAERRYSPGNIEPGLFRPATRPGVRVTAVQKQRNCLGGRCAAGSRCGPGRYDDGKSRIAPVRREMAIENVLAICTRSFNRDFLPSPKKQPLALRPWRNASSALGPRIICFGAEKSIHRDRRLSHPP